MDRIVELIWLKGKGCLLFKLDLKSAYRQIPVNPLDYYLLSFSFEEMFYFYIRLVFGQRSAMLACQHTTKGAIFAYNKFRFLADVYIDDFFGADTPDRAFIAFVVLKILLHELGPDTAHDKQSELSTEMLCLGIEFGTLRMLMRVPSFHLDELRNILEFWLNLLHFSQHDLQSLIGKLSYVAACVKPGRIFMSRLLNMLRELSFSNNEKFPVTECMRKDLLWWQKFLPLYNGVSIIKEGTWLPADSFFFRDACLSGFGAVCRDEYICGEWPEEIN